MDGYTPLVDLNIFHVGAVHITVGVCLFLFLYFYYLLYPLGGLLAQSGNCLSSGRDALFFFCHTHRPLATFSYSLVSFSHLNNLIMDGFMKS